MVFVEITLHRRGPEQLPSSQFFFLLVLGVSVCIDLLVLLVDGVAARSVLVTLFTTALDIAFVWAVLRTFERERRFKQTMSAMLGVNAMLSILIVPLALWTSARRGQKILTWPLLLVLAIGRLISRASCARARPAVCARWPNGNCVLLTSVCSGVAAGAANARSYSVLRHVRAASRRS
jgi:hypothetical protein